MSIQYSERAILTPKLIRFHGTLPNGLRDDLKGSYWVPEPVGRFVHGSKLTYEDGFVTLDNILEEQKAEFIASKDANFQIGRAHV